MFKRPTYQRQPLPPPAPLARPVNAPRCDGAGTACPKPVEHRNPALLKLARGKPCLFQLPGICTDNRATVVACHENQGKGMGTKASDARSAQGCSACHEAYDRGPALREVKRGWFLVAHGRQIFEWQRVVGDLSETPRNRRSAHWALCLIFEQNQPQALDILAQAATKSIAT